MKAQIPLQQISDEIISRNGVSLHVLRTDLNHEHISGNKLYKLKYNLQEASGKGFSSLLTFGGAYSNHIAATAAAGKEHGFRTIGVIRGEEISNPTLDLAKKNGMELHFVSRELYGDKEALHRFAATLGDHYVIPEGGANEWGIKGCMEIKDHISMPFDHLVCACGTGTTLAGIILSLQKDQKATGIQVLKAEGYIRNEVQQWMQRYNHSFSNWQVSDKYHFGGYARHNEELLSFIKLFEKQHGIPLDPVYTGKMMFGLYDLITRGYFSKNERIIAVHTGGLQGRKPA